MLLVFLTVKKLLELLEKRIPKLNQQKFRIEKVVKRKGETLYMKWKGYDNCFDSWIDKTDIII